MSKERVESIFYDESYKCSIDKESQEQLKSQRGGKFRHCLISIEMAKRVDGELEEGVDSNNYDTCNNGESKGDGILNPCVPTKSL